MPSKIALLATGDEIIHGDILNTNSQRFAQALSDHCFEVGFHMTVPDHKTTIVAAIHGLLATHECLIITGGLGPTSDDLTRFALADALAQKLIFDEACWQAIIDRLTRFNLSVPESNKQQAFFPENAVIITNDNGTAAGCYVFHDNKLIVMLPGPPPECLPMFHHTVLPLLEKHLTKHQRELRKWRLFGVSESHVATELEKALAGYDLVTGYRIEYPYIEFKISMDRDKASDALWAYIDSLVAPYLLSDAYETASSLLVKQLTNSTGHMVIDDRATGGRLANRILQPSTYHALSFGDAALAPVASFVVCLTGLEDLWRGETSPGTTSLSVKFLQKGEEQALTFSLPFRQHRILAYAVEFIADLLLKKLLSK